MRVMAMECSSATHALRDQTALAVLGITSVEFVLDISLPIIEMFSFN